MVLGAYYLTYGLDEDELAQAQDDLTPIAQQVGGDCRRRDIVQAMWRGRRDAFERNVAQQLDFLARHVPTSTGDAD